MQVIGVDVDRRVDVLRRGLHIRAGCRLVSRLRLGNLRVAEQASPPTPS
jgi:hypothetical protein